MALKYSKNIEVNLNNILIMVGDLNIRDNNWNTSYPHHLTHADTLREILTHLIRDIYTYQSNSYKIYR